MNYNLEKGNPNTSKFQSNKQEDKLDPAVTIDMEAPEFREFAKSMVDYIADYLENIRERRVLPDVKPGYLRPLIPDSAPQQPDSWEDVMKDIERVIMPGITHWHSPKFHAYFPTANSYPAIVADMLSGAIACIGFTWIASPACTELEVVMLDWLGKMLNLPKEFLACSGGKGGGVIQGTASEATLVALLGAKAKKIEEVKKLHPEWDDNTIISKLVFYSSEQAHSSVERAGLLGGVRLRSVPADDNNRLRGEALEVAIKKDIADGLIPFYAVVTLGTTNSCAFDYLNECGPIGNKYNVWIHVDAAYAGAAFICPEYRHLMKGIETADSFNFNPHKWMLVNFDCSAMWLKDPSWVVNAFNVDPLYLKHDMQGSAPDYRHWQIPLGRRFRALKLWFVLRLYGVENIQAHIRRHCGYAKQFADLCKSDTRFEVVGDVHMGLVCFRLKGTNDTSEKLLKRINGRGNIHMVPAKIRDVYFLRMAVCSRFTKPADMDYSWQEVSAAADELLKDSEQAHSSVERAGLLGGVRLRSVPADDNNRLRGEALEVAIKKDIADGLIPFYAVVTLGTTNSCAFDYLNECGPIGNKYNVWIHVDAAYAGAAFICPEYRHLMKGIETADSFNFNPHKWMLVNFDCSAMWLKDPSWVVNAFNVDPLYLKHDMQGSAPDYRHWQIPLGRRFRALKLWFVLRLYGVENIQAHIRRHCGYAKQFADLCKSDTRFEVVGDVHMGLVCFRLKGTNDTSEKLLKRINGRGNIHMVPAKIRDVYFLRMAVCSRFTKPADMDYSWQEVSAAADELLKE